MGRREGGRERHTQIHTQREREGERERERESERARGREREKVSPYFFARICEQALVDGPPLAQLPARPASLRPPLSLSLFLSPPLCFYCDYHRVGVLLTRIMRHTQGDTMCGVEQSRKTWTSLRLFLFLLALLPNAPVLWRSEP